MINPHKSLERYVATYESKVQAARALGVSRQYLHRLLNGEPIPESVLSALKIRKKITYEIVDSVK